MLNKIYSFLIATLFIIPAIAEIKAPPQLLIIQQAN